MQGRIVSTIPPNITSNTYLINTDTDIITILNQNYNIVLFIIKTGNKHAFF